MVKLRTKKHEYMDSKMLSGWCLILFPFLGDHDSATPHAWLLPWQRLTDPRSGVAPDSLPTTMSSVAVTWNTAYGLHLHVRFHAGTVGVRTDEATGALVPFSAWLVTHSAKGDPAEHAAELRTLRRTLRLAWACAGAGGPGLATVDAEADRTSAATKGAPRGAAQFLARLATKIDSLDAQARDMPVGHRSYW